MKKIIAILLSVIMVFSFGVFSFAEDSEQSSILIPDFPTQKEGNIYFASETAYVKAGETCEIPIYIVSDFDTQSTGDVLVGLNVCLTGGGYDYGYISLVDLKYSDNIKTFDGFSEVVCETKTFDDPTINTVAFTVSDMSILHQEKLHIATATVEVSEDYPGGETDCTLELQSAQYYWYDNMYAWYAINPVEIWSPLVDDFAEQLEIIEFGDNNNPGIFIVSGHIIERPDTPEWSERLKTWFIEQALKIITFVIGVLEILQGVLPNI